MIRRTRLAPVLAAVTALLGTACGSDDETSDTTAAAVATSAAPGPAVADTGAPDAAGGGAGELSFVLLTGGPATDGGFYQAMVDGLKDAAADDGAISVEVRDNLASGGDTSLENAVREAASSGEFDLIVAHGFDLVPAVAKFAPDFPDQKFSTSLPPEGNPPNVNVYLSVFEEIGYNAGFLTAQGSTSKKIGFIGGPGLDFEKQSEVGFRQAVEEYSPGAEVSVVYTGSFEDPQLAQEATKQMIDDGVDAIWNQQAAGQSGVYTACAEAAEVKCFGNSRYSEAVSPDTVMASSVSDYTILVPQWAERLRAGAWEVGPDFLDIENGGLAVTDATDAGAEALPELQAAIDDLRRRAAAGEITVARAG